METLSDDRDDPGERNLFLKTSFYPRIHCSFLCYIMAATSCELNSSLLMKEVKKYGCLQNKFCKECKNKYTRLNCWRKVREKFDIDAAKAGKNTITLAPQISQKKQIALRLRLPCTFGGVCSITALAS